VSLEDHNAPVSLEEQNALVSFADHNAPLSLADHNASVSFADHNTPLSLADHNASVSLEKRAGVYNILESEHEDPSTGSVVLSVQDCYKLEGMQGLWQKALRCQDVSVAEKARDEMLTSYVRSDPRKRNRIRKIILQDVLCTIVSIINTVTSCVERERAGQLLTSLLERSLKETAIKQCLKNGAKTFGVTEKDKKEGQEANKRVSTHVARLLTSDAAILKILDKHLQKKVNNVYCHFILLLARSQYV
jgi:hypothetical protein